MWVVARRPRWIAALVLALGIAAGFAALGQWQLSRSFDSAPITEEQSETVVPLDTVAEPQEPVLAIAAGQRVSVEASFVADDYVILSDRINTTTPGFWVVGHAITESGASLAVALGWSETEDDAASAIATLQTVPPDGELIGRYLPSEAPTQSAFEEGVRSALAVSELVNLWETPPEGVYGGYLTAAEGAPGLTAIDSPRPISEVSLNLLNIFYAVEWVIFAGFAIFLWYRLVRDAWEVENGIERGPGRAAARVAPEATPSDPPVE
jgi:cytochrome oxidase assembly protein ShyY1